MRPLRAEEVAMKERLDVILVKGGYAPSREKAKAILMSGSVYVNGQKEEKAGALFEESQISLEVRGTGQKYVSRGGLKLEKALECWGISLEGCVCMDIGASTGGFTDCMLQRGAARVYAVDVGHGQLAWKLRTDERVVCREKTNFRYMTPGDVGEPLDFASADVSFISLTKILIPARNLLRERGRMVCLIKPQIEAGREKVGKKGVVRDPQVHREVIGKVLDFADLIGFEPLALEFSPVKGPEGNIEYLLYIRKRGLGEADEGAQPGGEARELQADGRKLDEREAGEALERILAEKSGISQKESWQREIRKRVEEAHKNLDREG